MIASANSRAISTDSASRSPSSFTTTSDPASAADASVTRRGAGRGNLSISHHSSCRRFDTSAGRGAYRGFANPGSNQNQAVGSASQPSTDGLGSNTNFQRELADWPGSSSPVFEPVSDDSSLVLGGGLNPPARRLFQPALQRELLHDV